MVTQSTDVDPSPRAPAGLIVLVIALLVGLASPAAAAQDWGAVTGTVVDAADGASLVGARVRLRRAGAPTVVRAGQTGAAGAYAFPRIRPGRYVLEVSALGYQRRQIPLTVELGDSPSVDVELRRDPFSLETVVEAPSRRRQRLLDAPASVSVLEPVRIRRAVPP
ncbi:MAG: carboxypeptidase-like regulatory domain-containing protein, partial [Salinibacter sp.]|uniref:carboxypeptidase-like regulatory domain-containing protein n=1 Tax=Salinibacter sp. TaxID=2065818 RepID=UPI002FC34F3D